MNYKVVIDASSGGSNTGLVSGNILEKDVALSISNYISKRLNDLGISNISTRTSDVNVSDSARVNYIKNSYGTGDDVIVISNGLGNSGVGGVEVIYALRDTDRFAKILMEQFMNSGIDVNKYYQLRYEEDTALDSEYIIRETADNESIVINYASVNDSSGLNDLVNNYEKYAEAVVRAIAIYTKNNYVPVEGDNFYTVKKGDSLYSIARNFGISVEELKRVNNLGSNVLSIGQVLRIPDVVEESDEDFYVVKSGDTLYQIARVYNTTVDDIKKLNNLSSNTLSIGQKLLIPGVSSGTSDNKKVYTVVKGDSLYKISNLYGVSVNDLINANNLKTTALSIGQQLVIPSGSVGQIYVVKKGDTLYQIARVYNTTVDEIKRKNNLSGNTLSIGQVLKV